MSDHEATTQATSPKPTNGSHGPPREAVEVIDDDDEPSLTPFVLAFLETERGHQLANRTLDLVEGLKKATLDEQAKSRALNNELARLNMRHTWWLKTIGLVIVIGAIVGLSATNTLRGEASTILGAMAGYLFAQKSKES
ncbi:MAG: hypothetical protein KC464_26500 [Myxococcales bacterium]|nr:hypothetical protein [Myxococcales bacterium]